MSPALAASKVAVRGHVAVIGAKPATLVVVLALAVALPPSTSAAVAAAVPHAFPAESVVAARVPSRSVMTSSIYIYIL